MVQILKDDWLPLIHWLGVALSDVSNAVSLECISVDDPSTVDRMFDYRREALDNCDSP